MLILLAVVLAGLWLLGMTGAFSMFGFLHLLLILAFILVLVRIMQSTGGAGGRSQVSDQT
ncbi:lmo0937 family membrane protein [Kineobactrum salinum]|uniref:Lmo0937 family membrane protein n=2 Tax=Kineobactrum salinum TaxID=2708301 RepID=A0A6C0U6D1_9GAMM|nr:lmo0937 family membrane protein [Kineobactrum salinum]